MTVNPASPRMLVLARESRGLTQAHLVEVLQSVTGENVTQGYISRAEKGRLAVTGDRLEMYAQALRYPSRLLQLNEREIGAGPGLVHHRKKQAATAGDLRRIHAMLNLTHVQMRALLALSSRPAGAGIPHIFVDDYDTPEGTARTIRAKWGVGLGPLPSVIDLLEEAGALVACRDLVAPKPLDSGGESVPLDAVSACPEGEDPLVLLNAGTPAERQRFTLAHELGHMVMHPVPHPDQERQADRFAAELLLPARDIRADLQGSLSLPRLLELKERWRVSMWALLRRAHTLGAASDWQYRTLAVEMSSLGYRTREPAELDPDTPSAVPALIAEQLQLGRTIDELAAALYLSTDELSSLYLPANTSDPGGPAGPASSIAHGDAHE